MPQYNDTWQFRDDFWVRAQNCRQMSVKPVDTNSTNGSYICENDLTQIKGKSQVLATWLQLWTEEFGKTPEQKFANALETIVCKYFLAYFSH